MKVSEYYGLEIYSDQGYYVGEVQEVALDFEEGKVAGLIFEDNLAIPYENVMAVGDIILAKSGKTEGEGTD